MFVPILRNKPSSAANLQKITDNDNFFSIPYHTAQIQSFVTSLKLAARCWELCSLLKRKETEIDWREWSSWNAPLGEKARPPLLFWKAWTARKWSDWSFSCWRKITWGTLFDGCLPWNLRATSHSQKVGNDSKSSPLAWGSAISFALRTDSAWHYFAHRPSIKQWTFGTCKFVTIHNSTWHWFIGTSELTLLP